MSKVCGYCLCTDGHMGPCPHQEIERLRAENERLRAAVIRIARAGFRLRGLSEALVLEFVDGFMEKMDALEAKSAMAGEEQQEV